MTEDPQKISEALEIAKDKKLADDPNPRKKTPTESKKPKKLTKKQLLQALEEAQTKVAKYKTQLAYVQAEHENYVKSMERREVNLRLQANRDLILTLLPILDDLERSQLMVPRIEANDPFIEGLSMLVDNLKSALAQAGVTPIECTGESFDPLRHEAVVREESTKVPPNTVVEELRKGYLLKGSLLRPSMVKIAIAPNTQPQAEQKIEEPQESANNVSEKK